jgi:hypothetical protein
MAGSIADEDEEVLDISDQTRRPNDGALKQQRIRAWNPYLDPWWFIGTLYLIAAVAIPVGRSMSRFTEPLHALDDMSWWTLDSPAPRFLTHCYCMSCVLYDYVCALVIIQVTTYRISRMA